jgi:O-methyltransferase
VSDAIGSMELPPPLALFRLTTGYYVSRALWVVARLGIADQLAAGPRRVEELAEATGTQAPSLRRVLRLLASAGVFAEEADGHIALTPIGQCLRAGVPGSMRAGVLLFAGRTQDAWSDLMYSVQTGEPIYPHRHGVDVWTYTAQHPEDAALFDEAMADFTRQAAIAVVAAYDFSPFGTILDVGGGAGALLAGILTANPALRGVLFDRPDVVERARAEIARRGLADRCTVVGGTSSRRCRPVPTPSCSSTSSTTGTTRAPRRSCAAAAGPPAPAPACCSWRASIPRASTSPTRAGARRRTTSTCWSTPAAGSARRRSSARSTQPQAFG